LVERPLCHSLTSVTDTGAVDQGGDDDFESSSGRADPAAEARLHLAGSGGVTFGGSATLSATATLTVGAPARVFAAAPSAEVTVSAGDGGSATEGEVVARATSMVRDEATRL